MDAFSFRFVSLLYYEYFWLNPRAQRLSIKSPYEKCIKPQFGSLCVVDVNESRMSDGDWRHFLRSRRMFVFLIIWLLN